MKLTHIFLLLLCLTISGITVNNLQAQQYPGTNLRGKVVTVDYYGNSYPLAYATVDLYYFDYQYNQWVFVISTMSDAYGFYFINYILPGNYVLQVNKSKNYNISVVQIDYRYYSYQDLPMLYF